VIAELCDICGQPLLPDEDVIDCNGRLEHRACHDDDLAGQS
jgi:hypothetical protein